MARNFDNPYLANVIGLWDFRDGFENDDTGLADGVAQDGTPVGSPTIAAGWMNLNGADQRMDVDDGNDSEFDLAEGTLETEFRAYLPTGGGTNTVVSRGVYDSSVADGGQGTSEDTDFFEVRVTEAGSVEVFHKDNGSEVLLSSSTGFAGSNDVIRVTYSWDEDGVTMKVMNTTDGTSEILSDDQGGMTLNVTDSGEQSFAIGAREVTDGVFDQYFDGAVDYVAVLDAPVLGKGNGIVDGTAGDDVIDLAYTGDPQGDMIDNEDAILPGQAPNDDIVDAGAGDDIVEAGLADDTVYGGGGSDTIYGESGDDVLHGDTNAPGGGAAGSIREALLWSEGTVQGDATVYSDGDDLSGGFTQDTGSVDVTFSVLSTPTGSETEFSDQDQLVNNIDTDGPPANDSSALQSRLFAEDDAATFRLDFSDPVSNVSFRINDIDGDGQATVRAYDENGDPIEFALGNGPLVTLSDDDSVPGNDTGTSQGGYADPNAPNFSMLVTVPGPVGRIEIDHVQVGPGSSIVTVTDVFFDVPAADTSTEGDDIIDGGTGNDILIGYGGDDTLIGGDGDDDISGGDGSDTVDGGDGDDTIDTSGGGAIPLPDRGFPAYNGLPAVPADADPLDDRDTVDGGDGDDTILTGDDDDIIDGGDGDDTIDGGLDDDTIDGGDGDDTIIGGEGADTIDGGLGDDTIYGGLDPRFPDSLNIPNDGAIVPADPETTNGMDVIDGGAGDDTIFGQDDDDIIDGGTGDDTLDGGIDDDIVDGGDGNDTVLGGQGNDVVDGSDGDDIVDGGDGSDLVIGGAGADQLFGGDENDIIGGGIGDVIEGGEGGVVDFDTLIVSGGIPVVDYTATDPEAGTITFYDLDLNVIGTNEFTEIERAFAINLDGIDPGTPPVIEGRTFTENVVEGTAGDDVIDLAYTGDPEGDRIDNMDARPPLENDEDLVVAGAGDDIVRAGEDSDLIFGNSGDDQLFGEAGNDGVQGGTGDDFISGGAGGDILVGGEGDDTITGDNDIVGDTADLIFGNEGDDTFINNSQGDIITGGEDADGLDIDTLDLRGTAIAANPGGTLTVEYDATDPEAGVVRYFDAAGTETGTVTFSEIEVVIPCFTPGTLIATPKGERRVEDLKVGDRVITRDNGIQAIRWLGKRTLNSSELLRASHLQPVLIRQGALGNGLPERDMMVSPNHRVLVANDKTALYFEEREVLVAAKHLTGLEGVDRVEISSVTYIHFMFEQHEVVLSDGAWTESFQPGDQTLDGLGNAQRNEIFELFPELKTREGLEAYQSARRSLKKHEAHLLTH